MRYTASIGGANDVVQSILMKTQTNSSIRHDFVAVATVICVFILLCILTWHKWVPPFIDSGREMNAPLRLLYGESLYRQIYFQFGPFPPYFNAFLYRAAGVHLDTLYWTGIIASFLMTMMVFSLARKFVTAITAMLATLAVESLCIFKYGGHAIFPYTFGALYGTLLGTGCLIVLINFIQRKSTTSLYLCGILGGLAFLCKLEFGFAALATVFILILALPPDERRGIALRTITPMLMIPAILYGWIIIQVSPTVFLKQSFFLPQYIPAEQFFFNSAKLGLDRPAQTIIESTGAILGVLSVSAFIGILTLHMTRSREAEKNRWLQWLYGILISALAILLLIIFHLKTAAELSPLRTLPLLCAILIYRCWRDRRDPESVAVLLLSVYSFIALTRVLTRVPSGGAYGAFLVPVPIVLFTYVATSDYPKLFSRFGPAEKYTRVLMQVSFLLIDIAVLIKVGGHYSIGRYVNVQTERGAIDVEDSMGHTMNDVLAFIERNTKANESIAAFPEGSSLNFLSGRPVPMRYEILIPGFVNPESTEETIRELDQKKVKYIFIVNRPTSEFGKTAFGVDYAQRIMNWIKNNYEPDRVFGKDVTFDSKIGDPNFFIKCYKRKSRPQSDSAH